MYFRVGLQHRLCRSEFSVDLYRGQDACGPLTFAHISVLLSPGHTGRLLKSLCFISFSFLLLHIIFHITLASLEAQHHTAASYNCEQEGGFFSHYARAWGGCVSRCSQRSRQCLGYKIHGKCWSFVNQYSINTYKEMLPQTVG